MEKYIFLDFDGVLNTSKGKFDQKAIGKLRRLLERCDAKVIISSTKGGYSQQMGMHSASLPISED